MDLVKCIHCNQIKNFELLFYENKDMNNPYCLQCAYKRIDNLMKAELEAERKKRMEMRQNCDHDFCSIGGGEASCDKCGLIICVGMQDCDHNYDIDYVNGDGSKNIQCCKICNHTIYNDFP